MRVQMRVCRKVYLCGDKRLRTSFVSDGRSGLDSETEKEREQITRHKALQYVNDSAERERFRPSCRKIPITLKTPQLGGWRRDFDK